MTSVATSSPIDVSIVIATRDRCESLRDTLHTISEIVVPASLRHEVIVVDNGSRDDTSTVLADARTRDPHLIATCEPRPGKSRSLNHALGLARGKVLLFTDDDVRCPKNWLVDMCQPILQGNADAVSGRVVLPPEHIEAMRDSLLASRPGWVADTHYIDFASPQSLVGANMAIGRHVFDQLGGFDEDLGPGSPHTGLGEETLLCCRLLHAGFTLVGVEDAAVEHYFDLSRLDDDAVLGIARKLARSGAYMNWHWYRRGGWVRPWTIPKLIAARWIRRLLGSDRNLTAEEAREERLGLESRLAYLRAYRRLQRGPRKYDSSTRVGVSSLQPRQHGLSPLFNSSVSPPAQTR